MQIYSSFKINDSLFSKCVEAFQKAIENLQNLSMPNEQKTKILQELQKSLKSAKSMPNQTQNQTKQKLKTMVIENEHEQLKDVTDKLKVEFSNVKGRHSIAKEIIMPGEVIVKNKATAFNISLELSLEYCFNCLDYTMAPIPCHNCSAVVFCSSDCYKSGIQR